jgi:hypothetical protein
VQNEKKKVGTLFENLRDLTLACTTGPRKRNAERIRPSHPLDRPLIVQASRRIIIREGNAVPFICIQQPDGLWTVWDKTADEPATLDGKPLIGLAEIRARAARKMLSKIRTAQGAIPPKR